MFTKVHHVTYIVRHVQQMAEYLEGNFGLKPKRTGEVTVHSYKYILYEVGSTMVDFLEPTSDDSPHARQLNESGPGVAHVAWGVEGLDVLFADLKDKGNQIKGDAPSPSPHGYRTFSIDTSSSHGIYFQMAEGELS